MNPKLIVLLTRDLKFEDQFRKALSRDVNLLVSRNVADALQAICEHHHDVKLVVVDFNDGCHGMTVLSAIKMLDDELPIIGVTSSDTYHGAALAYANGAIACLAKAIGVRDLRLVLEELDHPKRQLTVA